MKKKHLLLWLTLCCCGILITLSCNKHIGSVSGPGTLPDDKTVTASIQGRVLDESGVPVKDAAVTSGTASTTTDVNGVFSFQHIKVSSRFGYVKVVKQGYFAGSRSIIADEGSAHFVAITLLNRISKGTFAAASGGKVVITDGNAVSFVAGTVVTASGNAVYTGTVHVFAAYLNPTDSVITRTMPGDLRGIGTDGKETALQSYGMMAVELEGDAGEKLQIASGKKATITLAIPGSLGAGAPATIPLWYFNDTTGKWVEEGTATRQGSSYVGEVGHFTYWNCDAPSSVVNFNLHLQDPQGNPLVYAPIRFVVTDIDWRGGYTDADGNASGLILKGTPLRLQVLNPCGSVVFEKDLGSVQSDLDLGNLSVDLGTASLVVSGTVIDCSNNPVASGFVNILLDGLSYRSNITAGSFSLAITRCSAASADAVLTAGDLDAQQSGASVTLSVTNGSKDAGQLSACGTAFDQFINMTIRGTLYSWTTPPDQIGLNNSTNYTIFTAQPTDGSSNLYMYVGPAIAGTGTVNVGQLMVYAKGSMYTVNPHEVQLSVTEFGDVGGYISGTLQGNVVDSNTHISYPMTGSLKVKRTE